HHASVACLCVIDKHVSAGLNRGPDHFAVLVKNVAGPAEHITSWSIRTIFANNESLDGLIIGRRHVFTRHFDDRSGYGYRFSGAFALLCMVGKWLGKCQWCKQSAADNDDNWFLHLYLRVVFAFPYQRDSGARAARNLDFYHRLVIFCTVDANR